MPWNAASQKTAKTGLHFHSWFSLGQPAGDIQNYTGDHFRADAAEEGTAKEL